MTDELGMEEALDIAMEAELQAQAFYAQAAAQIEDPNGRDLLGRLAAFENYHYQKLAELAQALKEDGTFIEYEARTVEQFSPLVGKGEASGTRLPELKDVVSILSKAIENEKVAREQYHTLAETTSNALGQAMFRDLANEETIHQRILEDEFFSLSNQGVWGWSGMYGE
jgi:rubrerythrin